MPGSSTAKTRLAHISDFHISRTPGMVELTPKRLVGYVNFKVNRSRRHDESRIAEAVERLAADESPDIVVATGDLAQTGLDSEFAAVREHLAPLTRKNIPVVVVAGNHDLYGGTFSPSWLALRTHLALGLVPDDHGIIHFPGLELLALEEAVKSPVLFSYGRVDPHPLENAMAAWRTPPAGGRRIVLGHYPVIMKWGRTSSFFHGLKGWKKLLSFLKAVHVSAYFCGHIHKRKTLDLGGGVVQYTAPSLSVDGRADLFEVDAGGVNRLGGFDPDEGE